MDERDNKRGICLFKLLARSDFRYGGRGYSFYLTLNINICLNIIILVTRCHHLPSTCTLLDTHTHMLVYCILCNN